MASHWEKIPRFDTWAYKYIIWLEEISWKISPILDQDWAIYTNIQWLSMISIDRILNNPKVITIEIEHDLYSRLNSGINNNSKEVKKETTNILENLYYKNKEKFVA